MKKLFCFLLLLPIFSVPACAVSAAAYAVMDADTGVLLAASNADAQLPMASTTKIMTGLLAAEDTNIDRIIEVPASCAGVEGSSMYLQAGEKISLRDVLYGLMLCSGNDAAECIAEVCGGREAFVERMNGKATELGLSSTHFDNPSGLDGEAHHTTAAELAKLTSYALKNDLFAQIVSTVDYTSGIHYMHNHNKMLLLYPDCIGVKTGFTKSSGRCLVSAAKKDGRTVVAVTLNDPDDWSDHAALLDSAFDDMHNATMLEKGDAAASLHVISGTSDIVNLVAADTLDVSLFADENAEMVVSHPSMIYAPVRSGTALGTAYVKVNGTVMDSVDLITSTDIALDEAQEKLTLWEKFRKKLPF